MKAAAAGLAVFLFWMPLVSTAQKSELLRHDQKPKSDVIEETVAGMDGLDAAAKEKLRIRLAIADFLVMNGRLPRNLSELVPLYFSAVPKNPVTNMPFAYTIQGDKEYLLSSGSEAFEGAASAPSPDRKG